MGILLRANDALNVNPPAGNDEFTTNGSNWLWAVTAVYGLSFLIFWATSFRARSGEQIFHYIFTIALLAGTIGYYTWAADLGFVDVVVANSAPAANWTRQIFYAKYIFWVVEHPAIIVSLGLISGVSWATIVFNVFLSWTWIISYLISAVTPSNYKWGFFAFGTCAWLILAFNTLSHGLATSRRIGVSRDYLLLSGWTNFLWLLWPIAYGVTDGGNKIGVTPGAIFFGVLDILLTPVLAFAFLTLSRTWDYSRLNLAFTRYGRVHDAGTFPEKATAAPAAAPAPGVVAEQPTV